ncbi:hypothetical protein WS83_00770 [Burkholderia sp. MSMB2042]|uniref:Uncharacterized protein n=1 Tax=Burkholderia savannae TaxID=1637837 RepID=A0ABR5T4H4_9BURK|nr:hypothetical protein WS78_21665 [Burkholderia savannae]KVG37168.1 hypothetical protein WS77_23325 [Burkholderia sp. MSMB0265]KVG77793.1 hypothetical protein WS81_18590 [Burkholderia sp. MSMB2040]KVG94227.1 hypothetical protein WS83_00770 [Burkholderia sp. MSMB2042]KVG97711.1 hypothetical protein WS82_28390 [Burkholderia sp. MSMB2041]
MIRQSIRSNSHGKRTPIRDRGFQCGWAVLIDSSAVLRPLSSLRFVDVPRDGLPRAFAIGPSAPASSRGATNGRSDLARGVRNSARLVDSRARRVACGVSHVACGAWRASPRVVSFGRGRTVRVRASPGAHGCNPRRVRCARA